MVETVKNNQKSPTWLRRVCWGVGAFVIVCVVLMIALRVLLTLPAGHKFVESQINLRNLGSGMSVTVSGFSGDPLGRMQIDTLSIKDREGVWMFAEDITLDWSPRHLLSRDIRIESLDIQRAQIDRRPLITSNESPQPSSTPFSFIVSAISVPRLELLEPVIGQAATLSVDMRLSQTREAGLDSQVFIKRLDAPGDTLDFTFLEDVDGQMRGEFDLQATQGGVLTRMMGYAPDVALRGTGDVSGTRQSGVAKIEIDDSTHTVAVLDAVWTQADAKLEGQVNLQNWSLLEPLTQRLGNELEFAADLDRRQTPYPLKLSMTSQSARVNVDTEMQNVQSLPTDMNVFVVLEDVASTLELPPGYAVGRAQFTGRVQLPDVLMTDTTIAGDIELEDINSPSVSTSKLSGPLTLVRSDDESLSLKAALNMIKVKSKASLPIQLPSSVLVETDLGLQMSTRSVLVNRFALNGADLTVTSTGRIGLREQSYNLSGRVKAATLSQGDFPSGAIQSDYRIQTNGTELPALTLDGAFRPSKGWSVEEDAGVSRKLSFDLFQTGINFTTDMSPRDNGVTIRRARIENDKIIAVASGRIDETLDITGELDVRAGLDVAQLSLPEDVNISFTAKGSVESPAIRLDSRTGRLDLNSNVIKDVRLRIEAEDIMSSLSGTAFLTAETDHGPVEFGTRFSRRAERFILNEVDARFGALMSQGEFSILPSGVIDGKLELTVPDRVDGNLNATLLLSEKSGQQGLDFEGELRNLTWAGVDLDRMQVALSGNMVDLSGAITARGAYEQAYVTRQFDVDMPVTMARQGQNIEVRLRPNATYGRLNIESQADTIFSYAPNDASDRTQAGQSSGLSLSLPLQLNGSPVAIAYRRNRGQEILDLDANNLPVSLLPLPESMADVRGRLSGALQLTHTGTDLRGEGELSLSDLRGFDTRREDGIDAVLGLRIAGSDLSWDLDGQSQRGFRLDGKGALSVSMADSLAGVRLDMQGPLSGELSATGDAAPVLELVTPSASEPQGELEAALRLSGSAASPRIDGAITATQLAFEAPELGTQVRNGSIQAKFSNDQFSIDTFDISDSESGRVTGQGAFDIGALGRPIGTLSLNAQSFRLLDRRDVDIRVDGQIDFTSATERASVKGNIELDRSEVKQFTSGSASVVLIDVEDVNAPDRPKPVVVRAPAYPIDLDLGVNADRRLFIRSNGLDVEMGLELQIKGTLDAPEIYGAANVLRGGYKLAGKTLEFTDGSISFSGDIGKGRVDMNATTNTQNLSASVNVTGTVTKPEIQLSSTPERPEDEILSALLFGRSATELSALEAAQLAGALAQFSGGGGGFDLLGGLRDTLGVGQLSVGISQDGTAQIRGGRYLAKDVYLEVFSGGSTLQTGAIIEWEIRENLALRSQIQADTEQSFSLKWKRDF